MSVEENKALVRQVFEGLNAGSSAGMDGACAPGYQLHFPLSPVPLDLQNAKPFFQTLLDALPGVQHEIEDILGEGNKVVVRLAIKGVHNGELMGIPASGRPVNIESINVFDVQNGKVVEQWVEFDALGMMQQIGAIPGPGQ